MNSLGKVITSRALGSNLQNFSQKFSTQSKFAEQLSKHSNTRLSSAASIHKSCFNCNNRIEQTLLEEVGVGQGDPALNPSPS